MSLALLLSLIAFTVGFVLSLIAGLWTVVLAFLDHWGWGLASLFVPCASLVFILLKWSKPAVRRSFFLGLAGSGLMFLGIGSAISLGSQMDQQTRHYDLSMTQAAVEALSPSRGKPVPAANPKYDYKQSMSAGYLAFKARDYPSAKLNFQQALEARPGDRLAAEALLNTNRQILKLPLFEGR